MVRDFNLHHPRWNPQGYNKSDPEADELIDITVDHELELLLPANMVIYKKAGTQTIINLAWATP